MFYSKTIAQVLTELNVSEQGLSKEQAQIRLKKYGYNEFGVGKRRSLLDLFIDQFRNYLLILLILAAIVAYFMNHYLDATAITLAIVLNVFFGMLLEHRADKSMDELRKLSETNVVVLRDKEKVVIPSRFIVPGDIIFLEEGSKVPADARVLESYDSKINEASLTGESMSVKKNTKEVALDTPLAERSCMVFGGSFVISGTLKAVVVATGSNSEFGKIEKTLGEVKKEETTLEKTLNELSKTLSILVCGIVGIFFFLVLIFGAGGRIDELFIYCVSLIVAAVPEGMLTVLTIVLAFGVKNMAKENALIRKLHAVETLGNISFIVTDKTGTVTQGDMTLVKIYDGKSKDFAELSGNEKLLHYSYLCNNLHFIEEKHRKKIVGDEMDRAIAIAGIAKGIDVQKLKERDSEISFTPFDAVKKSMSGVYKIKNEKITIEKGAPESILDKCSSVEWNNKPLNKQEILRALELYTRGGMRVIAVAYKKRAEKNPKNRLTFLGLLAFCDPIKKEARQTIDICKQAGIKILMLTGDNLLTAKQIGMEIGLIKENEIMKWNELEKLSSKELERALKKTSVIARATPLSKLKIIEELIKQDEVVAMTGDGVNDAPALKKAHVAVVMGKTGTDVSKEVADLVLMDDNLATLEKAIENGRRTTNNIMNFLRFQITTSIGLVLLSLPYVIGIKLLEPIHILWTNIVMDGPPALALGLESSSEGLMKKKPEKKAVFIDKEFVASVLNMSIFMVGVTMVVYFYYSFSQPEKTITMVFNTFALMQIFNAFNNRSKYFSFYSSIHSNPWLVFAALFTLLLQLTIMFFEPARFLFKTVELNTSDIIVLFVASAFVLVFGEAEKMFKRK